MIKLKFKKGEVVKPLDTNYNKIHETDINIDYMLISVFYSKTGNKNVYVGVDVSLFRKIKSIKNHHYNGNDKCIFGDDDIIHSEIYYRKLKIKNLFSEI